VDASVDLVLVKRKPDSSDALIEEEGHMRDGQQKEKWCNSLLHLLRQFAARRMRWQFRSRNASPAPSPRRARLRAWGEQSFTN